MPTPGSNGPRHGPPRLAVLTLVLAANLFAGVLLFTLFREWWRSCADGLDEAARELLVRKSLAKTGK